MAKAILGGRTLKNFLSFNNKNNRLFSSPSFSLSAIEIYESKRYPVVLGDRVVYPPGFSYKSNCDWIPPRRVDCITSEYMRHKRELTKADGYYLVYMNLLGVEFESEQELFDYYINTLVCAIGCPEEAKKRIYLVSCGWGYGFGAKLDREDIYKLQVNCDVLGIIGDLNYNVKNIIVPNVQPSLRFAPMNRNLRLNNIFSYHHLSEPNSNWKSDHWLINIQEPDSNQTAEFCIKMLAEVVGSEEVAIKKIYIIWSKFPFGFGAEINEVTANKLRGSAHVQKVLPDYAFDIKDKYREHRGVLYIRPSSCGLKISHYVPTGEHGSEKGFFSMEQNVDESDISSFSCAIRSVPQLNLIERKHLLNDIFSYHYLSEHNSEWNSDHWLIHIKQPKDEFSTEQQTVDSCIRILAEVIGSVEDAKQKIYTVWCKEPYGFGAEIDEVTSNKLKGLPDVLIVLPDYAFDINRNGGALVISPSSRAEPTRRRKIDYFPLFKYHSEYHKA